MIADALSEIQTKHLVIAILERYRGDRPAYSIVTMLFAVFSSYTLFPFSVCL
jgi:hypothetical protein